MSVTDGAGDGRCEVVGRGVVVGIPVAVGYAVGATVVPFVPVPTNHVPPPQAQQSLVALKVQLLYVPLQMRSSKVAEADEESGQYVRPPESGLI